MVLTGSIAIELVKESDSKEIQEAGKTDWFSNWMAMHGETKWFFRFK